MSLDVKVDILQCKKHESIQCEDYFRESEHNKEGEDKFFCLCDGASVSYDSLRWSKIIAEQYVEDKFSNKEYFRPYISSSFVKICINKYKKDVDFDSLSWSHQSAFLRGSFSTLLGVSFIKGVVYIFAVGDSIAFKLRKSKYGNYASAVSFPYKTADEFKNSPALLSSISSHNYFLDTQDFRKRHIKKWPVKHGDIVLLMTDAISEWLIKDKQLKGSRIKDLMSFFCNKNKDDIFKSFVSAERSTNSLKTDDTTVVKLEFRNAER